MDIEQIQASAIQQRDINDFWKNVTLKLFEDKKRELAQKQQALLNLEIEYRKVSLATQEISNTFIQKIESIR